MRFWIQLSVISLILEFFVVFLGFSGGAMAQGVTALEAFRVLERHTKGKLPLGVLEVVGVRGEPQPREWRIVLADAKARGGVREYVVRGREVVMERAPLVSEFRANLRSAVSRRELRLDTWEVFLVADREARRAGIGFDSVTYELRREAGTGEPVWRLDLYDWQGVRVGRLGISAWNLMVTEPMESRYWGDSRRGLNPGEYRFKGGVLGKVERFGRRVGDSLERSANRFFGNLQEWLTGERTIGLEEGEYR